LSSRAHSSVEKSQRPHDQQTAHGRRAGLGEMAFWAVAADRLALALLAPQHVDQRPPEDEPKDQRRQKGPAGTKGDVAKQVKDVAAIRKCRQPVKHDVVLLFITAAMPEFADRVNDQRYLAAF